MHTNRLSRRLGGAALALALGLGGAITTGSVFSASPALAYCEQCGGADEGACETDVTTTDADGNDVEGTKMTCDDDSWFIVPKTAPVGGKIHITGGGLFTKDGKDFSVFGQKFDYGDALPKDPPIDPTTDEPAEGNSPMWSMLAADKDGKLDVNIQLPTPANAQDYEDMEQWNVGTEHLIHFLSGSMKDGDYQRGARTGFKLVEANGDEEPSEDPSASSSASADPSESSNPTESSTETATPTATATDAVKPKLSVKPELIGTDDFVNKDKGVTFTLSAQKVGGKVAYAVTSPSGVKGLEKKVTVGEDGTASWNLFGLDPAKANTYVGKYKVAVKGTDAKSYSGAFEVVGDSVAGGDDGDDNTSNDNGDGSGANGDSAGSDDGSTSDEANAGGNTGGSLPKTGAELGALGAGIVLLVGGGAAVLLTLRRRKKN